ncbi:MAG TPA: sulfotransferase [Rhodothermales bacterium]
MTGARMGVKDGTSSFRVVLSRQLETASRQLAASCYPIWKNTRSLFVLSTGRTGTETLMHLLALSPEIDAFHEPNPQLMMERKRARIEVHSDPQKYRRIFAHARSRSLLRSNLRSRVYAETSARLTFFAPVIADMLPEARFVYIHRHPAEVVRSGMRRGWYVNHPADFARIEPGPAEMSRAEWEALDPFDKICWYWNAYNEFSLDFVRSLAPSRVLSLNAREVFDGSSVDAIFGMLGVPVPPAADVERVLAQKHNAQRKADFPRYESWTPEQKERLFRYAGATMERLGYAETIEAD